MEGSNLDIITVVAYFVIILVIGFWSGRGKQDSPENYYISKKSLPWWAIGAAYVATGLNSEQLIGMNGMGYMIGLPLVNSYFIAIFVYTALIFFFFPLYLRNNILTMPQYLGERFNKHCQNIFSVLLLISYIFISLAVVLYGGAKLFEIIFGVPLWLGVLLLSLVAGTYTIYGGMSSMINTAVFQFILMFLAGGVLFWLGYIQLPNGWNDIVDNAPGGFHLMQPMDYPIMPWHAVLFSFFNLQLFYSCINQALVQRGMGAKSEWDVRMAIIFALGFVFLRPFLEIFPGMMAKALANSGRSEFIVLNDQIDNIYPLLIEHLVPIGLKGLVLVGILGSVMSTISAFLNSISTIFAYDIYKKWINKNSTDKHLVKIGIVSTFVLMFFGVIYAPLIGKLGGIFIYFQAASTYLAVPIATCFLFGMFWKRTSPMAALTVMIVGIPLALFMQFVFIPLSFSEAVIDKFSLTNFYIIGGITQFLCVVIIVAVSLNTTPRINHEINSLTWNLSYLKLPEGEPKRPLWQSVWLWWGVMVILYGTFYVLWW